MSENMELVKNDQPVMDTIVIDDGTIDIPIQNQRGERVGTFRFNPSDLNIANRYEEVAEQLQNVFQPLADTSIDPNGDGADAESAKIINEVSDKALSLMDYVLNGDSKTAFFSKVNMFTPIGGRFFYEIVFNAVGDFVSKRFDTELKKLNARMAQHTHGYKTGAHAKGKK